MAERTPKHVATCLHCHGRILAYTAAEWAKAVRGPCPHCHKAGW